MPDERKAIVDRREQIASEPHPSPQHDRPEITETKDVWRVYRWEWIIKAASEKREHLVDLFKANFEGRVKPDHWRIAQRGNLYRLELFLPNVKGEFKHVRLALDYMEQEGYLPNEAQPILRNSKADHDLRAYGVKMLLNAKTDRPQGA